MEASSRIARFVPIRPGFAGVSGGGVMPGVRPQVLPAFCLIRDSRANQAMAQMRHRELERENPQPHETSHRAMLAMPQ
jgi:hypothetical protein